VRKSVQQRSAK